MKVKFKISKPQVSELEPRSNLCPCSGNPWLGDGQTEN
jgi:hypothetical protein